MRFARIFIDRPILAAVLSLVITLAGALALLRLPISEYPSVVPPTVVVRGVYPGANPKVIAETVASPLEQQINGVEDMLYMFSQATADGRLTLTITFAVGTNLDTAQVQVQNRVAQALPRLPQEVQRIGLTTEKASPDIMMAANLVSPDGRYDMLYLSNLAHLRVKDELARIPGVGAVQVFGAGEYSMRVWLDPDKLAARELTATDVVRAIREQNVQVAAGTLGAPPTPSSTTFQLLINAQGRLTSEDEFGDIVVRATPTGQITRVRDVGRVELGADQYALRSLLDNKPAVTIGISQRPGSNALQASSDVRALFAKLKQSFPEGVDYKIIYDPTLYVRDSIRAVVWTLFEAIALVVVVVLLFLQTWRASIIPLVAVPVSLVGTFAVMLVSGFSLNTLSLFGLVLAIGIVVDDAIVVVENVERHIERGLAPREATYKAMEEVSGPIIAIALVLCAVFIPTAFVSGLTGQFYRQFALTIAISTVISAFNSLTLSPALASRLLRPHGAPPDVVQRTTDRLFGRFFRWFNRGFNRGAESYVFGVTRLLRVSAAVVAALRRPARAHGSRVFEGAARVRPGAGQGLPGGVRPTARRVRARPHGLGDPAHVGRGAQASGRRGRHRVSGPVGQRVRQRSERRHRVRHPEVDQRPQGPRAVGQRHRGGPEREVRGHPGGLRRGLSAAPGAGTRIDRRLQALRGGPGRERLRGVVSPDAGRHCRGLSESGPGGPAFELPGERAADRHARRSRARQDLRRGRDGRVRDAAGLPGLGLRERLQPVRPHLPGERAGRAGVPAATGADRPAEDPQRARRDGAARVARVGVARLRARPGDALQRVPGGRDQRRRRARLQLGTGAGGDLPASCASACRVR